MESFGRWVLRYTVLCAVVLACEGALPALIPGGAMVAAIAVGATGAVLSASIPPPPQPGLQLDPTVSNVTNPYAALQPPITDFSRPPAVMVLRSGPLRAGRPADVTLLLSDGATGHSVDDLLVRHRSRAVHGRSVGAEHRAARCERYGAGRAGAAGHRLTRVGQCFADAT